MGLLPGDLVFVRGHLYSLVDDGIKLGEWLQNRDRPLWGMYTHVALSLGGNALAEAQGGRTSGYAMLQEYDGNYDIGHLDLTPQQRESIAKEAVKQFGRGYDWWLIGEIAIDDLTGRQTPYHERMRRICSTYARSVVLNATGLNLVQNPECTPEDLALCKYVTMEKVM